MAGEDSAAARGLDEIRSVLADLPGPDLEAATAALTRRSQLEKTSGTLGRLADHVEWLATWQARHPPALRRPRTAVFAGNHGLAGHLDQPDPARSAERLVEAAVAGSAPVNAACTAADADLRVYEMSLETPTRDATAEPAMDEEECARAIAYGMMAVEQGLDLICLDTVGAGGEAAAAAISLSLFGGSPEDWLPERSEHGPTIEPGLVAALSERHRGTGDAFEILRRLGGFEMCAVTGALIAGRLARTPVILGGYPAMAAAAVLFALDRRSLDHCRSAESYAAECGPGRMIRHLHLSGLMDFGARLGAGTEATLAVPLLRAAVEIHGGSAPSGR